MITDMSPDELYRREQEIKSIAAAAPKAVGEDPDAVMVLQDAVFALFKEVGSLKKQIRQDLVDEQKYLTAITDLAECQKLNEGILDRIMQADDKIALLKKEGRELRRKRDRDTPLAEVMPDCLSPLAGRLKTATIPVSSGPCVYFLCESGTVIYIGQTENLLKRVGEHSQIGSGKVFDSLFYLPLRCDELSPVEYAMISHFKPICNERSPSVDDDDFLRILTRFGLRQKCSNEHSPRSAAATLPSPTTA